MIGKEIRNKKSGQKMAITAEINKLINNNLYTSVDEFLMKNSTLDMFLKNHFEVPLRHFAINEEPINDSEYLNIVKSMTIEKQDNLNYDININEPEIQMEKGYQKVFKLDKK